MVLNPILRGAMAILLGHLPVSSRLPIHLSPLPEHLLKAQDLRAVGIGLALTFGVVFTVHRNPLLSYHPGGEPKPEAEKMTEPGMEL
jgi:hypothetical protein